MEAAEWVTRIRTSNSPSKTTVKTVVRYGCDFVYKAYAGSNKHCDNDEHEWRFSFSKAELIIIEKWTRSQRIIYRTFHLLCKIIKGKRENSSLCTYYFKTLMLWATEKQPPEFWDIDNLITPVSLSSS